MRFLSVGPEICLQLPSDSTSRWTPLLFDYTFPTTWACSGLSPVRARPWRANLKMPCTGFFSSGTWHLIFTILLHYNANKPYNGIDFIPFSNPIFFADTLTAYSGIYFFLYMPRLLALTLSDDFTSIGTTLSCI